MSEFPRPSQRDGQPPPKSDVFKGNTPPAAWCASGTLLDYPTERQPIRLGEVEMIGRMMSVLAAAMLAAGACSTKPAEAPASAVTPASPAAAGYAPVVSLNEIMVYVVDSHSNELWDAAMAPPTSDDGWKDLQRAAIAIAAAGSLTRVSGNGPKDQQWTQQADWAKYSQAMSDAGLAEVTAVRNRNVTEIAKAGDRLVVTCIDCHREYKLDVPKIWTERQFPPEEAKRP